MQLVETITAILFVLAFFTISGYAVVFMLLTPHKQLAQLSFPLRFLWYYGVGFIIFVIVGVFMSFVFWMAIKFGV